MTQLTLNEFKSTLSYLIDNNKTLVDKGDTPIAVCFEGTPGIGKTMAVQQVANEKGMTFVKINLSQTEEPADLIGFPVKEYEVLIDGKAEWIAEDVLKTSENCFEYTNRHRMGYATPSWLPRDFNPNGTMLVLDDFSRANSLIIQAVMEIINTGSYVSWELPKYTNIVLTSNPDNGAYNVTSMDDAVKSRMITLSGKFDIKEWAAWAESFGIDGRAINFALLYSDEIFESKNDVYIANARSFTTFCRAIAGIPDWSNQKALPMILNLASGCFLDDQNIIGKLFTRFIHGKLDKLITPERLINGKWEEVKKELESIVYQDGKYRSDISSTIGLRLLNYVDNNIGNKECKATAIEERLNDLIENDKVLLSKDILYNFIKTICSKHSRHTNKWYSNKNIREITF